MKNKTFIFILLISLAMVCSIVFGIVGAKYMLLASGIFVTLFYLGMKITMGANLMAGLGFKTEQTIIYDIICIVTSSVCFAVYAGL